MSKLKFLVFRPSYINRITEIDDLEFVHFSVVFFFFSRTISAGKRRYEAVHFRLLSTDVEIADLPVEREKGKEQ